MRQNHLGRDSHFAQHLIPTTRMPRLCSSGSRLRSESRLVPRPDAASPGAMGGWGCAASQAWRATPDRPWAWGNTTLHARSECSALGDRRM